MKNYNQGISSQEAMARDKVRYAFENHICLIVVTTH